jgi:hypothetical protein
VSPRHKVGFRGIQVPSANRRSFRAPCLGQGTPDTEPLRDSPRAAASNSCMPSSVCAGAGWVIRLQMAQYKGGYSDPEIAGVGMVIRAFGLLRVLLSIAFVASTGSCSRDSVLRDRESAAWKLGEPSLVLGTRDEGPTAFSPIRDVALSPRSELHVLLPQEHQVRVFGSTGESRWIN